MQILGSKKGASQPQKPHIAKDDLNSTSFFKGLYGLCEGEIEGLADGGKSIKLDGTPLINANGQPNFKGVTWDFRSGTLDQSHISGFPAVENEQNIGVELRHDRPYTKAINNKELSAVRVRLNLNALREQKDNGDIVGYAIEYAIDLQTDTGAFVEVLRQPIRGKASNGFKRSHRIDLPPAKKGWTIRVRRITPNRDSDLVADTMTVDAITEIIDAKLAYPCTALLGLSCDAKTFSNIPKVAVRLKGKIIQVPTNYNPQTRQYTGLWDGTFKMAYSNNPAWVFYDICTHRRYGLGERLNGMVDKWRLYQIGQYCDEMVDDGNWQTLPKISGQSVDIDGIYAGKYLAQVQAVDSFDNESLPTTSVLTTINGKTGKPPRLAKLAVKGILFGMQMDWTFARGSEDTNFTEIQVSPDGRSNIASLGTFSYPTNSHTINGLQGNLTQFYRARIVDKLGNTSDWTAWTKGITDNSADKVLDLLNGQITKSQLHNDLATPISKIPTLETGITAINGKLPTLENSIATINGQLPTLNGQIATLNGKATTLQNELNTAKNTLQTAVNNISTERNRINTTIRDITVLQNANNAKTQELANLTQTVGSHTSSIRDLAVTTGDLSQKYSQLKTATDTANSEITAIKQTQNGQATSIERLGAKFDNLSVGGRNLLLNTQNPRYYRWYNRGTLLGTRLDVSTDDNNTSIGVFTSYQNLNLKQGQDYVISFDVDTDLPSLNYNFILENDGNIRLPSSNIKQGRVVIKYTPSRDLNNARFLIGGFKTAEASYLDVKNIKLETGQVATDWTPAPEDLQADIDSKATTANLETLRQTLTNADTALSQQITAMDTAYKSADRQLTANLASEQTARTSSDTALGQRIDTLTADYNSNKASVANQLKTLTDKDTATASQISSLTANVTTAKQTADTATTKADNAQNTANNALNRANTANSAITAEQKARADADTALGQRITAIDTAYKSADSQTVAKLGQIEQSISDKDRAMAQRVDTLNANYTALDNRTKWTELTAVTDLNTLTETGKYFIRASSNPNAPFAQYAYVVVEKARADRITQTAWADNNASLVFIRVYNGTWQAWEKTATGKELREKASTATLNEFKQTSASADAALGERINAIDTAYKQADTATNAKIANAEKAISDNNTALSQRITALDTAYKKSDTDITARLAREETARASGDNANSQAIRTLESTVNGIGGRVGTSESKIATLERTTSDLNGAIATAQSQLNARFDNLAVGGRNLLRNSESNYTGNRYMTNWTLAKIPDVGEEVTVTLWGELASDRQAFAVYNTHGYRELARLRQVRQGVYTATFSWRNPLNNRTEEDNSLSRFLNIYAYPRTATSNNTIKQVKLEIGNIATDWTPAPEDVNVDLSPYATNATLNEFKRSQAQKDTATAQKLSQLETGLGTKANTIALDSLSTKVNQVDGKITAEAQKVSTLQTTVNGQTASIQQQATSIDGLKAQYTVKIDSGGRVSGFGLASGGGVSDFSVRADKFLIAPPSGNGKGDSPFMVLTKPTNINGTVVPSGTYIKDAYIANGSIDVAKINKASITSLSALTANIGHFKSAETGARLEIKDSVLLVYDDNNRLRVRLGVW